MGLDLIPHTYSGPGLGLYIYIPTSLLDPGPPCIQPEPGSLHP